MTRRLLAALLLLAAAAVPPATEAQDRVIARVDAVTPMSGSEHALLFSSRDADGRYRLMYAGGGGPTRALPGIAPRSVPFDADLGRGHGGRPLAVYSRCDQDPPLEAFHTSPPDYTRGRGCRIVEYDVIRERERVFPAGGEGEMLPAVTRDHVAFVRLVRGRPVLHIRPRRGGGSARRLPNGPVRSGFDHPTSMDLSGRRLAVAWSFRGQSLAPGSHIRLIDTVARTTRVLDHYRGGGLSSQSRIAPAFEGSALYWARACFGDPGGCPGRIGIVRYGVNSRSRAIAPLRQLDRWQARGAGRTWILRDSNPFGVCRDPDDEARGGTCTIVAR